VPHIPQERGVPEHSAAGALWLATLEAKVEKPFFSLVEPQFGHFVPFQLLERTSTSLFLLQASQ
jgi:hypothetical protein